MVFMICRSAASSSGVHAANDFDFKVAASDAMRPIRASRSSGRSWPGSLSGSWSTARASARSGHAERHRLLGVFAFPEEERLKTLSYEGIWSCRVTSVVRPAQ